MDWISSYCSTGTLLRALLFAALASNLASCRLFSPPGDDFDVICSEAAEVLDDAAIADQDKGRVLTKRLRQTLVHREAIDAWSAVESAAPERRYEMLRLGASYAGRPEWTCQPVEELLRRLEAASDP